MCDDRDPSSSCSAVHLQPLVPLWGFGPAVTGTPTIASTSSSVKTTHGRTVAVASLAVDDPGPEVETGSSTDAPLPLLPQLARTRVVRSVPAAATCIAHM